MRKMHTMPIHPNKQGGVALLEALIAILIFSIGILGVIGLQANLIQATGEAKYRAEASYIAQQRVGRIWADGAAQMNNQAVEDEAVPALPGGLLNVVRGCNGSLWCYRVTVSWVQPGSGAVHSVTTVAHATPTSAGL